LAAGDGGSHRHFNGPALNKYPLVFATLLIRAKVCGAGHQAGIEVDFLFWSPISRGRHGRQERWLNQEEGIFEGMGQATQVLSFLILLFIHFPTIFCSFSTVEPEFLKNTRSAFGLGLCGRCMYRKRDAFLNQSFNLAFSFLP